MFPMGFIGRCLPDSVESVMVVESRERFSKNKIQDFIDQARDANAVSHEIENGRKKREFFWLRCPHCPNIISFTKRRLIRALLKAEWNW